MTTTNYSCRNCPATVNCVLQARGHWFELSCAHQIGQPGDEPQRRGYPLTDPGPNRHALAAVIAPWDGTPDYMTDSLLHLHGEAPCSLAKLITFLLVFNEAGARCGVGSSPTYSGCHPLVIKDRTGAPLGDAVLAGSQ